MEGPTDTTTMKNAEKDMGDIRVSEGYQVWCTREPLNLGLRVTLISFVNKHNRQEAGNITMLTEDILRRIERQWVAALLFRGTKESGELVGSVMALVMPVGRDSGSSERGNGGRVLSSFVTYLCLHKNERGRGFAPLLVRALIAEGRRGGVTEGYFTIARDDVHRIPMHGPLVLPGWYRVLDVQRARKAGFTIPASGWSPGSGQERLHFKARKITTTVRSMTKSLVDRELFLAILSSSPTTVYPTPSEREWEFFVETFDLYVVTGATGTPIGLFGLFPLPVHFCRSGEKVTMRILSLIHGPVFKEALWITQATRAPILYGHLVPHCPNGLTREMVTQNNALITNTINYLGFYGPEIPGSQFSLPLL